MFALLLACLWISFGSLACSVLAARKGYDEGAWFALGAALGPVGLLVLWQMPWLEPISYLVSDPRLPELVECPACRRVVAARVSCAACEEPLPGAELRKRPRLEQVARRFARRSGG